MELFYAEEVALGFCRLGPEEATHCVRVLRHRVGEGICVIDGAGSLYRCTLTEATPREALARIDETVPDWGGHPYRLTLAVCPTKNSERYEWFAEKATEIGIDCIVPVIGARSERRTLKPERLQRILLSATKQSLKARIPELAPAQPLDAFIAAQAGKAGLKLIACCFEPGERRISIEQALRESDAGEVTVLIGPEGDFSPEEAAAARAAGFVPVHLGASRLRTETAALTAAMAVYLRHLED